MPETKPDEKSEAMKLHTIARFQRDLFVACYAQAIGALEDTDAIDEQALLDQDGPAGTEEDPKEKDDKSDPDLFDPDAEAEEAVQRADATFNLAIELYRGAIETMKASTPAVAAGPEKPAGGSGRRVPL